MAKDKKTAPAGDAQPALITKQAIWTGKERVEANKPLPDYLTEKQVERLIAIGAVGEETEAE